jgi:hypothetical protein
MTPAQDRPPELVQCGWCPVITISGMAVVLLHFAAGHGVANGDYPLRHGIAGPDRDTAELGQEAGPP